MVKSKEDTNNQMKKVFYIEKVEFLRSMMEFALKGRAEIYTVGSLENNFYLLADLAPDLILFDVNTCLNHLPQLAEYASRAKLVGMGSFEDRALVQGMVSDFLVKPLEAKKIASRILALLD